MHAKLWPKLNGPSHIILIAVLLSLHLDSAEGAMRVDPGGSIQEAIDSARPGDTIEVHGGIYNESLNVTKSLILLGLGGPSVDAGGHGSAITLSANGSVLEGFTATGSGQGGSDAGIKVLSQGNIVRRNLATRNGNFGFLLYHASNNTVAGNSASENAKGGILLVHSSNNQILENWARMNQEGISLRTSRGNIVRANIIAGNTLGINISSRNYSESISANKGSGVSIRYRPSAETMSYNISQMSLGSSAGSNLLYQNSLLDNGQSAYDDGLSQWDNDIAGNQYSDFDAREEGCKDRNWDGTCDLGYSIPGGRNVDRFPKASSDAVLHYGSDGLNGSRLSLHQRAFQQGEEIELSYIAPENFSGLIGIQRSDMPRGKANLNESLAIEELSGQSGALKLLAPQESGSYDLRMYNSTSKEEMASLSFKVIVPSINASPAELSACEQITVIYSGAPGYESDWIGMYRSGAKDSDYRARSYLDGNENGTLIFDAPDAGSYNFRIFENDSYIRLAESLEVKAKAQAGIKVVASPSRVSPGGVVTVTYWGAPASGQGVIGMYGITRPDKFWIEMRAIGGKSCGSLTFKAPYQPGNYDFRMFEDNVYRKILGQSNSVTVG